VGWGGDLEPKTDPKGGGGAPSPGSEVTARTILSFEKDCYNSRKHVPLKTKVCLVSSINSTTQIGKHKVVESKSYDVHRFAFAKSSTVKADQKQRSPSITNGLHRRTCLCLGKLIIPIAGTLTNDFLQSKNNGLHENTFWGIKPYYFPTWKLTKNKNDA
jgi:hypothetical protein